MSSSFTSFLLLLFSLQLVKDEPDLEPESVKHIFIENVMKLDPQTLTDNGFRCFDRFFRHVNCNDHKLRQWRRTLLTDSLDLMGLEYLWEVILTAQQGIAHKAIDSMKDIYTNLTPQLKEQNVRGEERGRRRRGTSADCELCVCCPPLPSCLWSPLPSIRPIQRYLRSSSATALRRCILSGRTSWPSSRERAQRRQQRTWWATSSRWWS